MGARAARRRPGVRPHKSKRYRLSFDHGWDIVDEYNLNCGTPGAASRAIAASFRERGTPMVHTFVHATLKRWRECGDPTCIGSGGSTVRRANGVERRWIKALIQRHPDLYFSEISVMFVARWRWKISDRMISQALHFEGVGELDRPLSLKVIERLARQRNDVLRQQCLDALTGSGALPQCYVIMDESSLDRRTLRRRRGWSPRGDPAKLYEIFEVRGSAKLQSLLAAVNKDGFLLDACDVVEGGRRHGVYWLPNLLSRSLSFSLSFSLSSCECCLPNSHALLWDAAGVGDAELLDWAENYLCPNLNPFDDRHLPNSILVLDNAVVHHSQAFVEMVEATGAKVLYLSPYSPDFSAIEFCFHQVKAYLRRDRVAAAHDTKRALWAAMASVTPGNMAGYFRNCGYPLPAEQEQEDEDVVFEALLIEYCTNASIGYNAYF
jgi:hypothetical protein